MTALAPSDLGRLAKICGLFGSQFHGERAAAAAQADRIVRNAGVTWDDLILPQPGARPAPAAAPPWSDRVRRHCDLTPARILSLYGAALNGWERCFLATLAKRAPGTWSTLQRDKLAEIQARFT